MHRGQMEVASDSRESSFFTEDPLTTVASPEVELQIPASVAHVVAGGSASARDVRHEPGNYSGLPREPGVSPQIGNVLTQILSQEGLSPLVARLICAVQQQNPAEEKVPPDVEARWQQTLPPPSTLPQSLVSETADQVIVCFSCGRSGHGVSRCSRMDTVFPFLPPG